jgi:glutamate 5-kinase
MSELRVKIVGQVKRIVIKLGSRLLVDMEKGGTRTALVSKFAGSVAKLRAQGVEVVIVTSGAVGSGMAALGFAEKPAEIGLKQACAATGQVLLMHAWRSAFQRHGLEVGQILCSADDFRERTRYKNISTAVSSLLKLGVVPVINENDSVAIAEIKVGDNDKLSADVSQFLKADLLIIFTDEDGLFDKNPKEHADARLLSLVTEVTPEVERLAGSKGSGISTGGMITKIQAMKQVTQAGCAAVLASGFKVLPHQVIEGKEVGTLFLPAAQKLNSRSRWLTFVSTPKGRVTIDAGAESALLLKGRSLLPVGVAKVEGRFHAGDIVELRNAEGKPLARGIAAWGSDTLRRVKGMKTPEARALLGAGQADEFVHRNNRVVL